jgi:hypothetical protein
VAAIAVWANEVLKEPRPKSGSAFPATRRSPGVMDFLQSAAEEAETA